MRAGGRDRAPARGASWSSATRHVCTAWPARSTSMARPPRTSCRRRGYVSCRGWTSSAIRRHSAHGSGMIVRNEARRLVTRRRTVAVGEGWERDADDGPATDRGPIESERAQALRSAFSRLGEECRQLLKLLFVDPPLSYDEIAAVTGRPRGSIGPSRQRCLGQLRRHLPAGLEASGAPCGEFRRTTANTCVHVFVSARPGVGHEARIGRKK